MALAVPPVASPRLRRFWVSSVRVSVAQLLRLLACHRRRSSSQASRWTAQLLALPVPSPSACTAALFFGCRRPHASGRAQAQLLAFALEAGQQRHHRSCRGQPLVFLLRLAQCREVGTGRQFRQLRIQTS